MSLTQAIHIEMGEVEQPCRIWHTIVHATIAAEELLVALIPELVQTYK